MASDLERDGVRVTRTGRMRRDVLGAVVLALGLLGGRVILRAGAAPPTPPVPAPASTPLPPPASPPAAQPAPAVPVPLGTRAGVDGAEPVQLPRSRGAQLRALRKLGIEPTRGPDGKPRLDAAPVIDALNAAGIHEGIAAFPPPGTNPPKPGIIVPDDFALPEGYVRRHQVTDDGQDLPPILAVHPDYELVDAAGQPIVLPDGVVPPELAPAGMPVQMLEVPEPGRAR